MCPWDPKRVWTHHPNRPRMHNSINPKTKQPQSFYFPKDHPKYPGWFKGMEQIIHECGLWPKDGLSVECTGPKHPKGVECNTQLHKTLQGLWSDALTQHKLQQQWMEGNGLLTWMTICEWGNPHFWDSVEAVMYVSDPIFVLRMCISLCSQILKAHVTMKGAL